MQGLGGLGGYGMAMGGGTPGGRGSLGSSLTTPLPQEQPDLGAVAGAAWPLLPLPCGVHACNSRALF